MILATSDLTGKKTLRVPNSTSSATRTERRMTDVHMKSLTLCLTDLVEIEGVGVFQVSEITRPSDGAGRRHIRLDRKFLPSVEIIVRTRDYMEGLLPDATVETRTVSDSSVREPRPTPGAPVHEIFYSSPEVSVQSEMSGSPGYRKTRVTPN